MAIFCLHHSVYSCVFQIYFDNMECLRNDGRLHARTHAFSTREGLAQARPNNILIRVINYTDKEVYNWFKLWYTSTKLLTCEVYGMTSHVYICDFPGSSVKRPECMQ